MGYGCIRFVAMCWLGNTTRDFLFMMALFGLMFDRRTIILARNCLIAIGASAVWLLGLICYIVGRLLAMASVA